MCGLQLERAYTGLHRDTEQPCCHEPVMSFIGFGPYPKSCDPNRNPISSRLEIGQRKITHRTGLRMSRHARRNVHHVHTRISENSA